MSRLKRIIQRLVPSGDIAERTMKSGVWMMGINVLGRLLQILLLIVLARLLTPRDLGLVGIALLVVSAMQKFTNLGLNAALIHQKEENVDAYLNTTWCLEVARGLLIAVAVFLIAPHIATLFNEPTATPLIQVIGISPLLFSMRNPGVVYFQKDLEFHKEFVFRMSGFVMQFVVGVGYALYNPSPWALVFAFVANDATQFVVSYAVNDYRPSIQFSVARAKELIDYGIWITGSSVIYFLYSEGDDVIVGWLLSAAALGFYQYAYRLSNAPSTEVSEVISSVVFPAYSKLQDDPAELRDAVLKTLRVTAFFTFPMAVGIAIVTPSFVRAVLGPDWVPMIVAMQILTLYGLIRAITRPFGSVWKAIGRPDLVTKLGGLRVVLIAVLIYPFTAQFGIAGTAMVVTLVSLTALMPLDIYFLSKSIETNGLTVFREFVYPLVASGSMGLILWYVTLVIPFGPLGTFLTLIPLGVVLYAAAVIALESLFNWGIRRNLKSIVANIAG